MALVVVLVGSVLVFGLALVFTFYWFKAMLRTEDPILEPSEELLFRSPCAISYDKMLGFANGHVFVTNERIIWTPISFPKPIGSRATSVPLQSIQTVTVESREPYRGFAVPVYVSVPGHVYIFYVGFNTLSKRNAENFVGTLKGVLPQSRGESVADATAPAELPFAYPRWIAYVPPAFILISAALFTVALNFDLLTPYSAVLLIFGPIVAGLLFIYDRARMSSPRK